MMNKNKVKGKIDANAQVLKGKAQKAVGEFQMKTGNKLKGGISKAKGELNETVGKARLKMGDSNMGDNHDNLNL